MLVHHHLEYYAQNFPDEPCVTQADSVYTYKEVNQLTNRIANGFLRLGVNKGERVAILGENSVQHCLLFMAASKAGAVAVPLNYRLSPAELAFIINDSQTRTLLILDCQRDMLKTLRPQLNDDVVIMTQGQADSIDWDGWLKQQDDAHPLVDVFPSDPLVQFSTSGTTGNPKGVVCSHLNILSVNSMNEAAVTHRSNPGTSRIVCAPLFHLGGSASVFMSIYCGQGILLHRVFDPIKLLDDLEQHPVQTIFLVPAMIMALLQTSGIDQRDFSKLRRISYGASPISETLLRRALEVFQCEFEQMYGMTETTGTAVSLSAADHKRALEGKPELLLSCGRPNVGAQAKVMDTEGKEVERGKIGEIWLKSDGNMLGYHNLPETTTATLTDGWVHTGDAGYMDDEGYIYLKDRIKDMVVSGGENIYPVEVENVLAKHEAILDVAVIGVPDEKFGEALLAFVVLKEGTQLEVDEMVSFCRGKIAGYKIPRQLRLIDELPRNPSGKVLKKNLRGPYWENANRTIA